MSKKIPISKIKLSSPLSSPLTLAMSSALLLCAANQGFAAPCTPVGSPILVINELDNSESPPAGSLSAAITAANADPDCSQIEFDEGVHNIAITHLLGTDYDMNIVGPGSSELTIGRAGGILFTQNGNNNLHIEGLTISNSSTGIVRTSDNLSIQDVVFDSNGTAINASSMNSIVIEDSIFTDQTFGSMIVSTHASESVIEINDSYFVNNHTNDSESSNAAGALSITSTSSDLDLTISNTSFVNNSTQYSGAGALHVISGSNPTDINIVQSTFSGNSNASSGAGAIIISNDNEGTQSLNIISSTIFDNDTSEGTGGISIQNTLDGTPNVNISNSVIANNTGTPSNIGMTHGNITLVDHSWIGSTGIAVTTNTESTLNGENEADVLLPLADNGAIGMTHMPAEDSPLIDAGDPDIESAFETDQNGLARIVNDVIDIGATEVQAADDEEEEEETGNVLKKKRSNSGSFSWFLAPLALLGIGRKRKHV